MVKGLRRMLIASVMCMPLCAAQSAKQPPATPVLKLHAQESIDDIQADSPGIKLTKGYSGNVGTDI
jgi:hypothetical protein